METLTETAKKEKTVDDLISLIRILTATGASKKRLGVLRDELAGAIAAVETSN